MLRARSRVRIRSIGSFSAVTALTVLATTALFGAGLATDTAAAAGRAVEPVLVMPRTEIAFSPNDDGRKDVARVRFELTKPATVSVQLTRGQRANKRVVLGPIRLGSLRPGAHVWRWDGRKDNGRKAPDGRYGLVVKARLASGKVLKDAWTQVKVDTVYDPAPVAVTDTTLYPTTTLIHDVIRIGVDLGGGRVWHDGIHRGIGRITSSTGEVVDQWKVYSPADASSSGNGGYGLRHKWDARDASGQPLPAGTYWVRFIGSDKAGNSGRSPKLPVEVTHVPLVEASGAATVTAAASGRLSPFGSQYNRCGSVDPSARYADGFTLRSIALEDCSYTANDRDSPWSAATSFHSIQPQVFAPRGIRTHRVTMRGAPTADGESDVATLNVGGLTTTTPQAPGEAVTESATYEHPFRPTDYPMGQQTLMGWSVQTTGGSSYDVASFTVDYTYLTPQP